MDPTAPIPQEPAPEPMVRPLDPHHSISPRLFVVLFIVIILISTAAFLVAMYIGKEKGTAVSTEVTEHTGTVTPTIQQKTSADSGTHVVIQGSLQDWLKQKCHTDTSPMMITVDDLPILIDPSILTISSGVGGMQAYCASIEEKAVSKATVFVNIAANRSMSIYDSDSQPWGHGPPPDIGLFGETILDAGDIQMSVAICCSEGPLLLGDTGITLRGVRNYKTATGQSFAIALTNTAIDAKDSRLIDIFTPHTKPFGDGEKEIVYETSLQKEIVEHFFGKNLSNGTPEYAAVQQMMNELKSVNVK